jgi:hypothetical protein
MQTFLGSLTNLANGDSAGAQAAFYNVFQGLVTPVMNFATSQLGLGGVPAAIQKAVSFVPDEVNKALWTAIDSVAKYLVGGAQGGLNEGKLTEPKTFTYNGMSYTLTVPAIEQGHGQVDQTGRSVRGAAQ